mmetsp:Transcript_88527/g.222897  ORF Transcript_88527/g.222897 Transcript_88527/m.222897 type:complete len:387 (-) Transcript_88527:134-1294(-)
MSVDRERRRLTVGRLPGGSHEGGETGDGGEDACGTTADLARLLEGKEWVSYSSTTDRVAARKKEFADKDVQVGSPSGVQDGHDQKQRFVEMWSASPIQAMAVKCHKGKKPESPNQDSFSILIVNGMFSLYCVFDGHGPYGHDVSEMVRQDLVVEFTTRLLDGKPVKEAFQDAFEATQRKLEASIARREGGHIIDASMSGTTCTMAYHDWQTDKLYIAHVGDSRAVLGLLKNSELKAQALTIDHKPELPEEKKRIEGAGGRVVFDGFYNHRVFAKAGQYPGLNMSRALGDVVGHKEAGLSALPDVREIDLAQLKTEGYKIVLLLCTDGVWEFVENDEALKQLRVNEDVTGDTLEVNLGTLTKDSYDKWMKDSDNEISDDITGIAVVM